MWIEQDYEMKKVAPNKYDSQENSYRRTLLQKSKNFRYSVYESGKGNQHFLDS